MKELYLVKVWKENKFLFVFIVFFIAGQIFFSFKRIQNFPFFIYDMYSRPINRPETFTLYELKEKNNTYIYTQLSNLEENVFLNSIHAFEENINSSPDYVHQEVLDKRFKNKVSPEIYHFLKTGLTNDISSIKAFPYWLNKYILQTSDSFSIDKNTYRYSDKNLIQTISILKSDAK